MPLNVVTNFINGFPGAAQTAFNRAVATWSGLLNSGIQVNVTAVWNVPLPGGLVAICVPNPVENFAGAPQRDTWYPLALADKITNVDIQPANEDLTVFFSQAVIWNTGAGACPAGQYDLESIALHEMCHGLGFVSTFWVVGGWPYFGHYGDDALLTTINGVIQGTGQAAALGFALPASLHGHPSIYGLHVQDLAGAALTDPGRYSSISLGPALVGNNLFFDAGRTPIYAPNPFQPFTSIDHLISNTSLMRPSIGPGNAQVTRAVDVPVLAIMTALGWT
jgi:hypothetical protein